MLKKAEKNAAEQLGASSELGPRLHELRKKAKLSQVQLAARMGREGKGASNLISRIEANKVERPTLRVISEFVKACGGSLADVADALGITVARVPEAKPADKPRLKPKPKLRTPDEKLALLEAALGRSVRSGLFESLLYEFLKEPGVPQDYDVQKALAEYCRAYFDLLLRHKRTVKALGASTIKASRLGPDDLALAGKLAENVYQALDESGDIERKPKVDRAAALSGKLRAPKVKKAEERLAEDLQREIDAWSYKRFAVIETVKREYRSLLVKEGWTESLAGQYAAFASELCARAEETETDPARRKAALEAFVARAKDKERARNLAEFAFRRWDELKDRIPAKPSVLLSRQRR